MIGERVIASSATTLALVACGGGEPPVAAPPPLPTSTVPSTLSVLNTKVVMRLNTSRKTKTAFTSVGANSLVLDAAVWELRKADKLVGALELVTLDPRRVDTARTKDRAQIRGQILSSAAAQLDVDGLPVWSAKDGDRMLYVWYGREVLGVLQIRSDLLDPEETMTKLLTSMTGADAWPALAPEAFESDL